MEYESVSTILIRSLDLTSPPVALAYVDAATGMATAKRGAPAPSSCSFWRNAEAGFFLLLPHLTMVARLARWSWDSNCLIR